jgi:hypothetical protein
MVFPAQNPTVSSIVPSESIPVPRSPDTGGVSEPQEKITDLFPLIPDQQKQAPGNRQLSSDENTAQPEPGKIVDLSSKQGVKDTPIQTPDETTKKADREEKIFREEVDTIIHEQHN